MAKRAQIARPLHVSETKCVISVRPSERFQLDQIKNSGLAAIIDFNMRNIWKKKHAR